MQMDALKQRLCLPDEEVDEDISVTLSSLITSAVHDDPPRCTLREISQATEQTGAASALEPLSVLPMLIPCSDEYAQSLLQVIGEHASAKETVMALQEIVETLGRSLQSIDDEEERPEDKTLSPAVQLARVMRLYAASIPRLPKRKRLPHEVIQPLFSELNSVISLSIRDVEPRGSRLLLASTSDLVRKLASWTHSDGTNTVETLSKTSGVLYDILSKVVEAYSARVHSTLAQEAFNEQFSRLVIPSDVQASTSGSPDDPWNDVWDAMRSLGITVQICESRPSLGSLILLAHSKSYTMSTSVLVKFTPIIVSSIQSNTALDETLFVLLRSIAPLRTQISAPELPPDVLIPLAHVLPPLASVHPDPATRHQTFRLLSLVLRFSPSYLRLNILHSLLTDPDSAAQMRVAAVGLVKEAALEAVATVPGTTGSSENVFASPIFLRTLGSVLFRSDPPDLLDGSELSLDEFLESPEPLRLVEVLGLFYLLLKRDTNNRTGIRDSATSVQSNLLDPIRRHIERWHTSSGEDNDEDEHPEMQLGILQMWVERTSEAIDDLHKR
ncbi:hypothetical protein CERSUDRAFT_119148 [Gelatoporia subvermispora B]|uniref:Uncharacterized protein n=1 Tax=Ceriporiopsis subvermispora (strain B) TaxID=914234 RepID=M2R0V0_CERS8|nr:hypothetical protein CERSUDRAFT_119148 [Gelatoporia subvermispora B]